MISVTIKAHAAKDLRRGKWARYVDASGVITRLEDGQWLMISKHGFVTLLSDEPVGTVVPVNVAVIAEDK